jgi:hypothetical protein
MLSVYSRLTFLSLSWKTHWTSFHEDVHCTVDIPSLSAKVVRWFSQGNVTGRFFPCHVRVDAILADEGLNEGDGLLALPSWCVPVEHLAEGDVVERLRLLVI